MRLKKIILKKGKEKALKNRHHWIFSGAVLESPDFVNGEILPVFSHEGERLGSGYFNRQAKIFGRMLSFDDSSPLEVLKKNLDRAIAFRQDFFAKQNTNAYRLINGEGDFVPGLIVDQYDKILVIQIGTLGIEQLRSFIVEYLKEKLNPKAIYEKSLLPSRKEEGLKDFQGVLFGDVPEKIEILEYGLKFNVSIPSGQKTGFFLDHREMRQQIRQLSLGKKVLNCFSYTGGFSVYAAAGGAVQVDSVDISEQAIAFAVENMELNGLQKNVNRFFSEDVFEFLRKDSLSYDLVILDPPAFAKRQKDIIPACRGYKDINRLAIQKMPEHSLLLTSSCSYHVDESLFQKVVFQAAVEARRSVRIIGRHHLAPDHPINICHPESDYLKSLLLYVD